MKRRFAISLSLLLAGCGPLDVAPDEQGTDQIEGAITAPKAAPIASLGGICGKNWSKCGTEAKLKTVFGSGLKRTAVKVTSGQQSGFNYSKLQFEVSRLVNDHGGSKDRIEVTYWVLDEANWVMVVGRNGRSISQTNYNMFEDSETVLLEADRGGVEAHLAVFGYVDFYKQQVPKIAAGVINTRCGGFQRGNCKFAKILGLTGAAAISTYGGGALAASEIVGVAAFADHLRVFAAGVAALLGVGINCESTGKTGADACTDSYCMCSGGGGSGCSQKLETCCKGAGGVVRFSMVSPQPYCEARD